MPALYNLAADKLLDKNLRIIGVDHGDITKDAWTASLTLMMHHFVSDAAAEFHPNGINNERWAWITERCDYLRGEFDEDITYEHLAAKISTLSEGGSPANVLFYIATAPKFFMRVVDGLGHAGLLRESKDAFRRVVIEKPFGRDEPSAVALNAHLLTQGDEHQFYRIDHFLGKEAVRGIFSWRFANNLFEPIWNNSYIDHVQITAAETIGVETRGPFYEATGALRDMIPSHLFSVMSMIAMEQPASLDAEDIRNAQVDVLKAISPISPKHAARGQYQAGEVRGKQIVGYRDSDRVDRASRIETYAALHVQIDTPRWKDVPFYIRTGKALAAHQTSVAVTFKPQATLQFVDDAAPPNVIHFKLNGRSAVTTSFLAKKPGPEETLGLAASEFRYDTAFLQRSAVGYETLLYDCMRGQQTLFLREDMIEAAWRIVQPVLDAWNADGEPQVYTAGSYGPSDSDALLAATGRVWLPLTE